MTLELTITALAVFLTVGLCTWVVVSSALARRDPGMQRVRSLTTAAAAPAAIEEVSLFETPDPRLARLSRMLPRSPKELGRLRRQLAAAGYRSMAAALCYSGARLVMPAVLAGGVLLLIGPGSGWVVAIMAGLIGFMLPGLVLARKTRARQKAISNGLPDALDLLVVCVEAGSSLDQGILRTSEELAITHPALAAELRTITTEMRAGKPRLDAFRNFARRTQVEEVQSLVAMLTQTDRFGTSVSQALRIHADTSRTRRRQAAEERAGKVGVKLVFPLVLLLFPAVYVVCLGPVVVTIYRALL